MQHVPFILRFVFECMVRGNIFAVAAAVVCQIAVRGLGVLGFALTLQAILAAIVPDMFVRFASRATTELSLPIRLEPVNIVEILIAAFLLVYAGVWIFNLLQSKLKSTVVRKVVSDQSNFQHGQSLDQDIFVVEKLPEGLIAAINSISLSLFIVLVGAIIVFFTPYLALTLIPLVAVMIFIQVLGNRSQLTELHRQTELRTSYVNEVCDDGKLRRRKTAEPSMQRDSYFETRQSRRHRILMKQQFDNLLGALVIAVLVIYLFVSAPPVEGFAGVLIIYVIAIRNLVAAGHELATNLSRVLELRRFRDEISIMLKSGTGCIPS